MWDLIRIISFKVFIYCTDIGFGYWPEQIIPPTSKSVDVIIVSQTTHTLKPRKQCLDVTAIEQLPINRFQVFEYLIF